MGKKKASMGKRERGRPKKRKMEERGDGEGDSSHVTPIAASQLHQAPDLSSPPPGFLSVPTRNPPMTTPRYRMRQALLGQCGTIPRTPLRCAVQYVNQVPFASSTSRQTRTCLAEEIDQPNSPMSNIPTSGLPPQTQVSNFAAAALPCENAHNLSQMDMNSCPASSFNFTEIAALMAGDNLDLDGIESTVDSGLVTVNRYRVKEEMAPLLGSIFSKYGDIAGECICQSIEVRSRLLEIVCAVCQNLERTARNILMPPVELKSMLSVVTDLESTRLDVSWLHRRLDEIGEALQLSKGYSALIEELARNKEEAVRTKKQLGVLQNELAAVEAEGEKINEKILDAKAKIKCFHQLPLV